MGRFGSIDGSIEGSSALNAVLVTHGATACWKVHIQ